MIINKVSFAGATEVAEQIFTPVTFVHENGTEVVAADEAEFAMYSKNLKYKVKAAQPPTSRAGNTPTKRRTTYEEGRKIVDRNLEESLGIPSVLIEQGEGFTFQAVCSTLGAIIQVSRRTGGEFSTTQVTATVSGQPVKFCILLNRNDDSGAVVNLVLKANPNTQSGLSVERV